MNLFLETNTLTYITESKKCKKTSASGINGVKEDTSEIKENAGIITAAAVPAAIIGWNNIRHKIGF